MRCSHYVPAARRTKLSSARPAQSSSQNADLSTIHQPSNNLDVSLQQPASSPALRLSPAARAASRKCAANSSSSNAIKRALRDASAAKSQSCVKLEEVDTSTPLGDLHLTTTVLPGHIKHPRMTNSSSSTSSTSSTSSVSSSPSSASQQTAADLLRVGRPRPTDNRAGGGRHPHPPTGNNSKLKHKCPFDGCPWRFATPYKLRRHIKSHTKETPYRCKECDRGFSVRYNLLMHIQTIHSQPQRFKCPLPDCKDAFHSQSRLNGHLRRVHKSDWKSLQGIKETPKYNSRRGGSISSTDSSDSLPDSISVPPSRRTSRASNSMHKCQKCGEEFSSKVKLNAHNKLHSAQEKETLKCTVEACGKTFSSADKLSRHLDSHGSKTTRQFSCPHKNCNRIFLKANLLECHKRIHTQEDVFICPVPDCRQQFSSEGAYNLHLNTHVCYGHSCPYPNCDVTFLTQNRLDVHMQVVHGNMQSGSILDGIQPHHGEQLEHHGGAPSHLCLPNISSPNSPSLNAAMSPTTPTSAQAGPIRCVLENDFLKYMDLPGLTADDVKAALLEHKNWSGKQLDQFLWSAVDLSEIESRLSTWCSYESDSGYSTFDVSPITNNAPANLNFTSQMLAPLRNGGVHSPPHHHQHQPCPPLSLNLLDQSNSSPLFNNPPFMTLPLQPSSSASSTSNALQATSPMGTTPLLHDPMSSPCASDAGFFSPHFLNAQDQDCNSFFSNHSPMSVPGAHSFPPPSDYIMMGRTSSNGDIFCPGGGPYFPDVLQSINMPPLSDPFINEFCQSQLPICSLSNTSMGPPDLTFLDCTASSTTATNSQELPPPFPAAGASIKLEGGNSNPGLTGGIPLELDMIPAILNIKQEVDVRPLVTSMDRSESMDCTTVSPTSPLSVSSQFSIASEPPTAAVDPIPSPTTRSVPMKAAKRKSQWPKSINRASLMAFRERILSKLKKPAESETVAVAAIPVSQSQSDIVNFEVGEVEYLESLLI